MVQHGRTLNTLSLVERSQTQKTAHYMIPFIQNDQNRQIDKRQKMISGWVLEL